MNETKNTPEFQQFINVINDYETALSLLGDYDHQRMSRPQGHDATYILTYDECRRLIDTMRFNIGFGLFGHEKDDSFRGSIGDIYQTFAGKDVYLSVEEKAANLLYFITKNHSFNDGNKRITAALFLYFLNLSGILYDGKGQKRIADHTLVALTIMVAESRMEEKEIMVSIVMHCIG